MRTEFGFSLKKKKKQKQKNGEPSSGYTLLKQRKKLGTRTNLS